MITRFFDEYRFLSNFWPCKIEHGGLTYPSVEHAYQAIKFIGDRIKFTVGTPGAAKKLARTLKRRDDWDEIKVATMHSLLLKKFKQEPLKTKLLDTHPHELIEGNTWGDTFWGQCDGKGENMLGKLLVEVRNELREGNLE